MASWIRFDLDLQLLALLDLRAIGHQQRLRIERRGRLVRPRGGAPAICARMARSSLMIWWW